MALRLVTAPTVEPVTLEEARAHLRLDAAGSPAAHPDDALVERLIKTARQRLDGRDGTLGRCLVTQTWDLLLDRFPPRHLRIPLPPLQSVTHVKYLDGAGALQTLSTDAYAVDAASEPGWISPGLSGWPATWDSINAVQVRFVAGYPPTEDSPADYRANIPEPIRQAILLMLGAWYEHREAVVMGVTPATVPMAVDALLAPYQIVRFT